MLHSMLKTKKIRKCVSISFTITLLSHWTSHFQIPSFQNITKPLCLKIINDAMPHSTVKKALTSSWNPCSCCWPVQSNLLGSTWKHKFIPIRPLYRNSHIHCKMQQQQSKTQTSHNKWRGRGTFRANSLGVCLFRLFWHFAAREKHVR